MKIVFWIVAFIAVCIAIAAEMEASKKAAKAKMAVPAGPYQKEVQEVCAAFFGDATPILPKHSDTTWNRDRVTVFMESIARLNETVGKIHIELGEDALDLAGWFTAYREELLAHDLFNDQAPNPELRTFLKTNSSPEAWDSLTEEKRERVRQLLITAINRFRTAGIKCEELRTHAKIKYDDEKGDLLQTTFDARDAERYKLERYYHFRISEKQLNKLISLPRNETRTFPTLPENELQPILQEYVLKFLECLESDCPNKLAVDAKTGDYQKIAALCVIMTHITEYQRYIVKHTAPEK